MANTMFGSKIANPYSEALLQLGLNLYLKEENADTQVFFQIIFDMENLLTILKLTPVLEKYLANPLIQDKDKKNVLEKCLPKKTSSTTKNFLMLLVDKKRIGFLQIIIQTFLNKAYDFVCLKFVEVYSASPLSKEQQTQLKEKLKILLGPEFTTSKVYYSKINITFRIDKEILGGFIIKVDSKIIDLSLRGELESLAKQMEVSLLT
uniref:ATP synthase subunit delta, chloroplastic n=1 Tax=Undaria pinnatifida TaxID=74381 RepID=A0A0R6MDT5_UNDPI|nr:ATP synthase CF1 delta chain [Undaria pinnatifida]YP_011002536.1 ATP synthase CF1, subunit delta [Undaria peterseniana]AKG49921.1 ATP synthase CF1 delta chain [Undaria pinnatifida]AMM05400.1 ATP synthase CF1 delta chain [Undaria pinnatifida]UXC97036.1 ATP synthase CF1 delta chain [Undaria pinnatifida]UXC97174.1 ATP synthase CF1 delta chain [Undaria pinnatifida]UXC97312.1 ATP synthase CF1 delta chain [Undaria pinnatifida]